MTLADKIKQTFPNKINFPKELRMFCDWIEENGYDSIVTEFRLRAASNLMTKYFEGGEKLEKHIAAFGHGGDGGIFAIWDAENTQKIVFLGSEGDNWFVVANSVVDFLVILAIGYPNLAHDDLQEPPLGKSPDIKFRNWIEQTFGLTVPDSANNVLNKADKTFTRWLYHTLQPNVDFEHFDPNSKHNLEFHAIEYRLVVSNVPANKSKFIGDLRKVSTMSISELMKGLNNLPMVVYESTTYFNGQLSLTNFPSGDREALIYLTETYKHEVMLQYRNNVRQSEKKEFKLLG